MTFLGLITVEMNRHTIASTIYCYAAGDYMNSHTVAFSLEQPLHNSALGHCSVIPNYADCSKPLTPSTRYSSPCSSICTEILRTKFFYWGSRADIEVAAPNLILDALLSGR